MRGKLFLLVVLLLILLLSPTEAQIAIKNGVSLPTKQTIRALVIFAELQYDEGPCYGATLALPDGLQELPSAEAWPSLECYTSSYLCE